ncbi:MAG TPA: RNA-directed DNA polymerase [Ktedonobacteraceae bacterium]
MEAIKESSKEVEKIQEADVYNPVSIPQKISSTNEAGIGQSKSQSYGSMSELRLRVDSYRWAINHLLNKSDTDLFPRPFELEAIRYYPDEVEKALQKTNIVSYSWFGGRSTIVPKGVLSFRPATQLDPWDSLMLTALIHEYGKEIEDKRIPYDDEIVFSYRFDPRNDGEMYRRDADWPSFWKKSRERAASIGGYVAIADISSYYNQIYHPSLKCCLQTAGVPQEVVQSIIRLCMKITPGVSRGIPVGPHATHLLAECVFDPIDRKLLAEGYIFCRFVDDIHIFCKTKQQAQIAFYQLANILDKEQKLGLQTHKSKILSADEFLEHANRMIAEMPHTSLERDIVEVIDRYTNGDRYRNIDFAFLSEDDLKILNQQNLELLLTSYLDQNEPDFIRIRWLFRRLAQVGVPGAVPLAVAKLEQFSPALADLAGYLLSARFSYSDWEHLGDQILRVLELPIIQHSEYLRVILMDLFVHIPSLDHAGSILQKYPTTQSSMVRRKIVRMATKSKGGDHWLRPRKEEFLSTDDPWLKRAFIAGALAFSRAERTQWLEQIEKEGTELEKFVARWARSENQ